jgi:hypothetical protein
MILECFWQKYCQFRGSNLRVLGTRANPGSGEKVTGPEPGRAQGFFPMTLREYWLSEAKVRQEISEPLGRGVDDPHLQWLAF